MYEMPLIFVFRGSCFGDWENIFCIGVLGVGVLSLAFCAEITESLLGVGLHSKPSV